MVISEGEGKVIGSGKATHQTSKKLIMFFRYLLIFKTSVQNISMCGI